MKKVLRNGWAIALAWPETSCKQAGAWYDYPANFLGISKNHYYKVGHAALLLIKTGQKEPLYFDFGRYHAPFGQGRVRDKFTDHELALITQLTFDQQENIVNIITLLTEIQEKTACHGTGILKAGISAINFDLAYKEAKKMQSKGAINYGPFLQDGTNCSRFVNQVIKAGRPSFLHRMRLTMPPMLTPTPLWNVRALKRINLLMKFGTTDNYMDITSNTFVPTNYKIPEQCN